jgi:predicted RNA-binding Zn-ribbon protein involved in translation (DUF1610 family)
MDLGDIKVKSKEDIDAFLESLSDENLSADRLKEIADATEFVAGEGGVTFACPACGADVEASATECPQCGSTFAETGEVGCPNCGATVTPESTSCRECQATFGPGTAKGPPRKKSGPNLRGLLAEAKKARAAAATEGETVTDLKALRQELPRLVGEVKPMLLIGRNMGIDLAAARTLINDAVAKGKSHDIENAVRLVHEAKRTLHTAFTAEIVRLIEAPLASLSKGEAGAAEKDVETALQEVLTRLRDGEYEEAHHKARGMMLTFPATTAAGSTRTAATQAVTASEGLFKDCEALGIVDPTGNAYLADARAALAGGKNDEAARLAGKAREALLRRLPSLLDDEMRAARDRLIALKERGGDITKGIGRLKAASLHLKRKDFAGAAQDLRQFREQMRGSEFKGKDSLKGPKG